MGTFFKVLNLYSETRIRIRNRFKVEGSIRIWILMCIKVTSRIWIRIHTRIKVMRIRNTGASPDFSEFFIIDIMFLDQNFPRNSTSQNFFKLFGVPVAGLQFSDKVHSPTQNYLRIPRYCSSLPQPLSLYLRNFGYF